MINKDYDTFGTGFCIWILICLLQQSKHIGLVQHGQYPLGLCGHSKSSINSSFPYVLCTLDSLQNDQSRYYV